LNYIREFTRNSTILHDLLTYNESDNPIDAEFPPMTKLGYFHNDGVFEDGHATLKTVGSGNNYALFQMPERFLEGHCIVYQDTVSDDQRYSATKRTVH